MRKINKIDYFCGAFLSYLVSNGVEPTLFEAGDKSKILEFLIKDVTYKAFLKYSTKKNAVIKQGKNQDRWDIVFSPNESKLMETFNEANKKVIIVCICTDDELNDADIAVLSYAEACRCMGIGMDKKNEQRRISICHFKGSSKLKCYGTALDFQEAITIPHNFEKIFGLDEVCV